MQGLSGVSCQLLVPRMSSFAATHSVLRTPKGSLFYRRVPRS